ncbi:hypothetical protein BY996DRAFT_6409423 [Phakopsora pachyrhizi]|nr:hypothetical protein BY996DRAFT_6409423 [Phakopsora pachyrhizi]
MSTASSPSTPDESRPLQADMIDSISIIPSSSKVLEPSDQTSPNRNTAHFMENNNPSDSPYQDTPTHSRYHDSRNSIVSMAQRSSSTLSLATDEASIIEKYGNSNLYFMGDEESTPGSPDPLHTDETPYSREGPARYIVESHKSFTLWSTRGLLNISALLIILAGLIILFAG